jgi:hypothetical protein
MYSSVRSMLRSLTRMPRSPAIVIRCSRVIPSRMLSLPGGVIRIPSRTMKRFSALPLADVPSWVSISASS